MKFSRKDLLIHTHLITQNFQMQKINYLHWNVVTKYMKVMLKERGKFSGCLLGIIRKSKQKKKKNKGIIIKKIIIILLLSYDID